MRRAAILMLLSVTACGGGSSNPGGPNPPAPNNPFRITITASGASPKQLTVPPGTRVLFINNDSRRRNMTSDPHPEHNDCPEIDNVGQLSVGQSKETGNLNVIRTCGYHDHDDPDNNNVKGTIVIRP